MKHFTNMMFLFVVYMFVFSSVIAHAASDTGIGRGAELTDSAGQKVGLSEIGSENVTILAFWVPEADATVKEVEKLLRFTGGLNSGINVALISRGKTAGERDSSLSAARSLGIDTGVYFDPDLSVVKSLGVKSVPWFLPIDRDGNVLSSGFNTIDAKLRSRTARELIGEMAEGNRALFHEFLTVKSDDNTRKLIGSSAPGFKTKDIRGSYISMDNYKGRKPLFLVFWRESCPHCRRELPQLQRFYVKYRNNIDFEVIGIAITGQHGDEKKVNDFVKENMITFPIAADKDAKIATDYNIRGVPAIVYVDKNGVVRETQIGESDQLDRILLSFLSI